MLKEIAIRELRNYINKHKVFTLSPTDICLMKNEVDPNENSVILNNISYIVHGYILTHGYDDGFNDFIERLIDEIQRLY